MQFWVYLAREAWGEFGREAGGGGAKRAKRAEAYVKAGSSTVFRAAQGFYYGIHASRIDSRPLFRAWC